MGVLPALKGSKFTRDILPSLPPLNRRAVWLEPELQYDGREPPKAWLARLRQLKQIHGYSEKEALKIAGKCLKGDAELWFRLQQPHSFSSLRAGLHTRFASRPVTSVVKPAENVFLSDAQTSLSPKCINFSSLLVNEGRPPSKLSNIERSGSVMSGCRSKPSTGWKSTSRCLTPTKFSNEERPVGPQSVSAPKLVISIEPEGHLKEEDDSSTSKSTKMPSALSDMKICNNSKEASSVPKKVKQAVKKSSSSTKYGSSDPKKKENDQALMSAERNEKQSLAVAASKKGHTKCTKCWKERDFDDCSESSEENLGSNVLQDQLVDKTSKSMEITGDNFWKKNKDAFPFSSTK
ncbi:hypothetical protein R1flu_013628 [Riccia fluitans]|uniref:Uncharacterized protein n=1 Tax=Riccia fluitans TaxID=41844 RepID=A0ABD1YHH4_9MARC